MKHLSSENFIETLQILEQVCPKSQKLQNFNQIALDQLPILFSVISKLDLAKYELDLTDKVWVVWINLERKRKTESDWFQIKYIQYNFSDGTRSLAMFVKNFFFEIIEKQNSASSYYLKSYKKFLLEFDRYIDIVDKQIQNLIDHPDSYYKELNQNIPNRYRLGVIKRAILWEKLDWDDSLNKSFSLEDIRVVEEIAQESNSKKYYNKPMTANEFFIACEIGYDTNNYLQDDLYKKYDKSDNNLSPKEKYDLFADGRDCGLKEIEIDSPESFDKWYENESHCGGHPWEIARGGNETHIDLYVAKEESNYYLLLKGNSLSRIAETVRFAVALSKNKIPFRLDNADKIVTALKGEDFIGLVPEAQSPKYSQYLFEPYYSVLHVINPWADVEISRLVEIHGQFLDIYFND